MDNWGVIAASIVAILAVLVALPVVVLVVSYRWPEPAPG